MYERIDPIIRGWAKRHSLVLFEGVPGNELRSVYVSSDVECFQICVEVSEPYEFVVHAWSVDTANDEDLHQDWRATDVNLAQALDKALGQIRHWMTRSMKTEVAMRSTASLRLFGDDLDPEEVTRLLGCKPTTAHAKGQVRRLSLARTGHWHLNAPDRTPDDLSGQISEIFGQLNSDPEVWKNLTKRFKVDVFCGLFMSKKGEGFTLSTEATTALSVRNIKVGICLYGPT